MIGLDTNVLARYYIEDDSDAEAARQRPKAKRLMESGQPLAICKTVLLEFEWLMRGYYSIERDETIAVLKHLMALPHVTIEDSSAVEQALSGCENGLEFADAIHHASYRACDSVASFDDRRFARRVKALALSPPVAVPK